MISKGSPSGQRRRKQCRLPSEPHSKIGALLNGETDMEEQNRIPALQCSLFTSEHLLSAWDHWVVRARSDVADWVRDDQRRRSRSILP